MDSQMLDHAELKELPMDEKLQLLSDEQKEYLRGYMDRAAYTLLSGEEQI